MRTVQRLFALCCLVVSAMASAADADETLLALQKSWAQAQYQLQDDEQDKAYQQLLNDADMAVSAYPDSVELVIWHGIINSSYAGIAGALSAMKYANIAKADLESAVEKDARALNGSALTSLGTLYFKVPGWPIGFGDDDKAERYLTQALEINPEGIDSNYFYADYLVSERKYKDALTYLEIAMAAAPRPGRELADEGRRSEIAKLIEKIDKKLKK